MRDKLRAAAQAALDAITELEGYSRSAVTDKIARDAKQELRAALDEQGHLRDATKMIGEPVAWGIIASNTGRICRVELDAEEVGEYKPEHVVPLYTAPPHRREWKGLTEEEIRELDWPSVGWDHDDEVWAFYESIEAALKEKNHD